MLKNSTRGWEPSAAANCRRRWTTIRECCRGCVSNCNVGYEATNHLARRRDFFRHLHHLQRRARRTRTFRTIGIRILGNCPAGNCPRAVLSVFEKENVILFRGGTCPASADTSARSKLDVYYSGGCIVFARAAIPFSATTRRRRPSLSGTLCGKYESTYRFFLSSSQIAFAAEPGSSIGNTRPPVPSAKSSITWRGFGTSRRIAPRVRSGACTQ